MIRTADEISQRPGHWYSDQLNNHDAIAGYLPLGEEIWRQTGGDVQAFVHSVSTAHSIHGVTKSLWAHDERIQIVAVEPAESAVLSGKAVRLSQDRGNRHRLHPAALAAGVGERDSCRLDR